jgi:hypothetical protein
MEFSSCKFGTDLLKFFESFVPRVPEKYIDIMILSKV